MKIKEKTLANIINEIVFVVPTIIFFSVVIIIPFIMSIVYSFTSWNGISSNVEFIGFENFVSLVTDDGFIKAFSFIFRYAIAIVIINNVLGLLMALLLTQPIRGKNIFRAAFFHPHVMSGFILGFVWQFIFIEGFPMLAELTGIGFFALPWLATAETGFWGIVMVGVWKQAGYLMMIYIAGIMNIPAELSEASSIDGANAIQNFFKIKLPLIMPSITICLFLAISAAFNVFDINMSLTKGGPFNSTVSVSLDIYQEAFVRSNYGYGIAKSLVFFIVIAIVSIIQTKLTSSREVEI